MRCGSPHKDWIPEANGSGAAWLDYNHDGRPDLLIVNGGNMDQLRQIVRGQTPRTTLDSVYLYKNLGGGRFEDVTATSGLFDPYWGTGANAVDYNNDGLPDILITNIGVDLLFRNNGNGTFTEVGKAAGLSQTPAWHTGSAWGDFDNDGNLDLYVAAYIELSSMSFQDPAPVCTYLGISGFCGPIGLKAARGTLYRSNGDGTFTDATERAGLAHYKAAHSFTPVFDDFNGDGKIDLFIADDSDPNLLFINQGNGTFQEAGLDRGVAVNADGRVQSNMGVAVGDYDNKGRLGILTTTFADDYYPLFKQDRTGSFDEVSLPAGLASLTHPYLGWACGFSDFDNDGLPDLWTANGHVYPKEPHYNQPFLIFRNEATRFVRDFEFPLVPDNSYRGGATADVDSDGKIDVVVLPIAGTPLLLHNETLNRNNWIGFQLRGTQSNRDAIGATVELQACGQTRFDTVRNGGSYLSHNDSRVHFGLGSCGTVDHLRVRWPRGLVQEFGSAQIDRYTELVEGHTGSVK